MREKQNNEKKIKKIKRSKKKKWSWNNYTVIYVINLFPVVQLMDISSMYSNLDINYYYQLFFISIIIITFFSFTIILLEHIRKKNVNSPQTKLNCFRAGISMQNMNQTKKKSNVIQKQNLAHKLNKRNSNRKIQKNP